MSRRPLYLSPSLINSGILLVAIVGLAIFFQSEVPSFLSGRNLELLARQAAIVTMASLGMTLIIISGGIDLSVGSVVALVTVVIAALLQQGVPPFVALMGGVAAGAACGFANGSMITLLRVAPFIATLGMFLIARGAAKGLAGEQKIDAPLTWLNDLLSVVPADERWKLLPIGVWLTILSALALAIVLKRTTFGRYAYAIGSNEQAAIMSGIRTPRVKVAIYTLGGLFAGLAGLLQFSRLSVGDPTVAIGLELEVIAAVVIGGASLSGGVGSIAGTVLGALLMATIRMGCSQMGLANWIQEITTGGIIVAAIAVDRLRAGYRH